MARHERLSWCCRGRDRRGGAGSCQPDRITSAVAIERGGHGGVADPGPTSHAGCAEMTTNRGRKLWPVGQISTDRECAEFGGAAPTEYLPVTGHIDDAQSNATVCGSRIPFVAKKVETMQPQ